MSDLFRTGIDDYLDSLLPERNPVLSEMEDYAREKNFPIIGPQVGHFLYQIVKLTKPKMIFEMGSGFGYSAQWFLMGDKETRVICTELSEGNIARGKQWMEKAGFSDRVVFYQEEAQNVLRRQTDPFDIILMDVDKEQYPEAFHLALDSLRPGGILLTDNVLWSGRVADPDNKEVSTRGIREYNRLIFNTPGLFSSILPIRDGLAMSVKLSENGKYQIK